VKHRNSIILVLALLPFLIMPRVGGAAPQDVTITVTTWEEEYIVDGDCSLVEAIHAANYNEPYDECPGGTDSGMDTIMFSFGGTIITNLYGLAIQNGGPLTIAGANQVQISGNKTSNVFNVYYGADLTLIDLTIKDGSSLTWMKRGAALNNDGGTVLIDHCVFTGNTADVPDGKGGAVYNNAGSLTIRDSEFTDNSAEKGGAVYAENSTLDVSNTTFRDNSASDLGGAIYLLGTGQVFNSTFEDNAALNDGGAIYASTLTVSGSTFKHNQTWGSGGAIACSYGTCTLALSTFTGGNFAVVGGAINLYIGKLYVNQCLFDGNATTLGGGAINIWLASDFSISESTFEDNASDMGGGVYVHQSFGSIADSLFRNNNANKGGGLTHDSYNLADSELTLERTTFWENHSADLGGAIYNERASLIMVNDTLAYNTAGTGAGVYNLGMGKVTVTNSTLYQNTNSVITKGGQLYNQLGEVAVANSILAYGGSAGNCAGTITDLGANLENEDSCDLDPRNGNLLWKTPYLGPLQDNNPSRSPGYPTLTFALEKNSPAINNANDDNCPGTDQRKLPRRNGFCDIGSFEAQAHVFNVVSGDNQSTTVNSFFPEPLVIDAQDMYGNSLGGVRVTFSGPDSGPSIINTPSYLNTDVNGYASFQAIANNLAGGSYEVHAFHSIGKTGTTFHLTNEAEPSGWKILIFLPMIVE
jgi:predicted outer membrane repeat protein